MEYQRQKSNLPQWREVMVGARIPSALKKMNEIAHNLWWNWHPETSELFGALNPQLWEETGHNPLLLLSETNYEELEKVAADDAFLRRMESLYVEYRNYMDAVPDSRRPSVAYFSMEFGLDRNLKIYSGGLGVLAGDYLKEASDSNVEMYAVGLLYRYGYFDQTLTADGCQEAVYESQHFSRLPIEKVLDSDGRQLIVHVPYAGFTVHAKVWKVRVGRIPLYLLDTDHEMNSELDRPITHHLYGGDWENRLKQEILLGVGGVLMLKELGICPEIYHCNEGHAALLNLQRLCDYVDRGMSFAQALELVRASALYTVHTPVPAGHDYFDEPLVYKYLNRYAEKLGIGWNTLMDMGRFNAGDKNGRFCMSVFACSTSQEINGVSLLHKGVSQEMFAPLWKGYFPEENHVDYVTNGVHFPTWCASEWQTLYRKYFDDKFWEDQSDGKYWEAVYRIPDDEIWNTRLRMKQKLFEYIAREQKALWTKKQLDPRLIVSAVEQFNPRALLVGFARRFATYKRAHLLFTDLARLDRIVNDPEHPVRFIFAGKAHPNDKAGQDLIKQIIDISRRPEFLGKIFFLENYDMELARRMVSGVDLWLNTPTRKAEASGTSGEKALMNGVLNLSVPDGWWYEGYREKAGWKLMEENMYENSVYQDELDAATIYHLLENEIVPLYYKRNDTGCPCEWIAYIKNSMACIAPHYTMKRQLDDYYTKFYDKLATRFRQLSADNGVLAGKIAAWKQRVAEYWDSIEIVDVDAGEALDAEVESGKSHEITIRVDEKKLDDAVGIELVVLGKEKDRERIYMVEPFSMIRRDGSLHIFKARVRISHAGNFRMAFRMFPRNEYLPYHEDLCYVRWF